MYTWSDIGFLLKKEKRFFECKTFMGHKLKKLPGKWRFFAYFVISAKYTVVTIEKNNVWQSVSLLKKKIEKPKAKVLHASEN